LEILDGQIKLKEIKLIKNIERVKGKIFEIDVMRVQQVLINLVTNAIKYSPQKAALVIKAKVGNLYH